MLSYLGFAAAVALRMDMVMCDKIAGVDIDCCCCWKWKIVVSKMVLFVLTFCLVRALLVVFSALQSPRCLW